MSIEKTPLSEIFSAALLSAASLAIAWSAYQSTLWSGDQSFLMADAGAAGRKAAAHELMSATQRQSDGIVFMAWVNARGNDHERLITGTASARN